MKNNINNQIIEAIKNNKEINELQENETRFMQKLESDNIMLQTKISQLIKDLNSFLEMLNNKINIFQNNMKKIFQIINLSYYNYQISDMQVKKEITITKKLIDFNMISKKIDLNELLFAYQKLLKDFEEEKPIYNFEFKFEGEEYKKIYSLKPSNNDSDSPECVTKILELKKTNKLISGLISGQIYIWDLYSKSLDYSINAHKSAIWAMVKLSNDNIATGSSDKLIKIFDIVNQSSEPIIKFRGHKGTVFCIGEIEKNKIISGSEDKTIKLWDLNTKKCILSLEDPNDSKINCLYTLKDYGFIITGGDDNLIKIWNIHSKYIPNVLSGHECTIWSLTSLNDDDSIIASGSSDNTIKIWDLFNLRCLFTLEGHENTISSLKLLNNDLLVSSSWDKTAKIWNLRTRNCVYTLKGHKNIVWDVIQLDSGDLATCSSDMNIIVWSKSQ
jgi:WD40 repeat protein